MDGQPVATLILDGDVQLIVTRDIDTRGLQIELVYLTDGENEEERICAQLDWYEEQVLRKFLEVV